MRIILAFLFILGISVITIALPNRHTADVGLISHVQRTKQFRCEYPQLRSIPIGELLIHHNPEERFFPGSTVLARCDEHSGCCQQDYVCAPKEMEEVKLVFIVNHVIDVERLQHHEIIKVHNHTRCHCIKEN